MRESLGEFLTGKEVDPAHLQHAVRYLVAEWGQDPTPEQMLERLRQTTSDIEQLQRVLTGLEADSTTLEAASLAILQTAWDDTELHDAASGAVEDAESKLPVVEAGLIALVTMYGMYLAKTGGRRKIARQTIRRPDGSYETRETTEYFGPAEPLAAVVSLVTGSPMPGDGLPPSDEPQQLPEGEPPVA